MAAKKEEKFEQQLERLQSIVKAIESGECALEDSLKLFAEGVELTKKCQARLDDAQQKIEVLVKADKDKIITKEFA